MLVLVGWNDPEADFLTPAILFGIGWLCWRIYAFMVGLPSRLRLRRILAAQDLQFSRHDEWRSKMEKWLRVTQDAPAGFFKGSIFMVSPTEARRINKGQRFMLPSGEVASALRVKNGSSPNTVDVQYLDDTGTQRIVKFNSRELVLVEDNNRSLLGREAHSPFDAREIEDMYRDLRKRWKIVRTPPALPEPQDEEPKQQVVIRHPMTEQDILREFPWDVLDRDFQLPTDSESLRSRWLRGEAVPFFGPKFKFSRSSALWMVEYPVGRSGVLRSIELFLDGVRVDVFDFVQPIEIEHPSDIIELPEPIQTGAVLSAQYLRSKLNDLEIARNHKEFLWTDDDLRRWWRGETVMFRGRNHTVCSNRDEIWRYVESDAPLAGAGGVALVRDGVCIDYMPTWLS